MGQIVLGQTCALCSIRLSMLNLCGLVGPINPETRQLMAIPQSGGIHTGQVSLRRQNPGPCSLSDSHSLAHFLAVTALNVFNSQGHIKRLEHRTVQNRKRPFGLPFLCQTWCHTSSIYLHTASILLFTACLFVYLKPLKHCYRMCLYHCKWQQVPVGYHSV